eukprot:489836-Pyramimonas_sp.AAC.1
MSARRAPRSAVREARWPGSVICGIARACAFFPSVGAIEEHPRSSGEEKPRTETKKSTGNGRPSDGQSW